MKLHVYYRKAVALFSRGEFKLLLYLAFNKIVVFIKRMLNHNKICFDSVEITITEKCDLKCQNCANLMQYYSHPKNIEINRIISDVSLLMEHVDYTQTFTLMGGEPFIVKQLPVILSHAQKYSKKYMMLKIVTNGTIVPTEEVLLAVKNANVIIYISDYGEKSINLDKLVSLLKKYKIRHIVTKPVWLSIQQFVPDAQRSEKDVDEVFQKCQTSCNCFFNSKLYQCPFLAHGDNLRLFPFDKRNYLDFTDKSISKESIRAWQSKKETPPACRFCSGCSIDLPTVPVAKQIKEPLPYHRYDDVEQ